MNITKETFNEHDPRCRVICLDDKMYMAYDEGGVLHIIGEYTEFRVGRVFFMHRYKDSTDICVGELKDVRRILREDSTLIPAMWNGYKWLPGITNERLLPKKTWSFREQRWLYK